MVKIWLCSFREGAKDGKGTNIKTDKTRRPDQHRPVVKTYVKINESCKFIPRII